MQEINELINLECLSAPALTYENNTIDYFKLNSLKNQLKDSLVKNGIQSGQHVGLFLVNPILFLSLYLALWEIDATIVPLDSQLSIEKLAEISKFVDLDWLLSERMKLHGSLFNNYIKSCQEINIISFVYADNTIEIENISLRKEDYLCKNEGGNIILLTSGSSGKPKGVILKKRSIINNFKKVVNYTRLTCNDKTLMTLPLTYSYGISQTLSHMYCGAHVIFNKGTFSPVTILDEIENLHVTNYSATPYFYQSLFRQRDNLNKQYLSSSLRFFMNAGGLINEGIICKIINLFPGISFFNNYGQTEASPRLAYSEFNEKSLDGYHKKGVGKALPGVKIKIINESGHLADVNEIGEVLYFSEDFMLSYYGNNPLEIGDNNFFNSGDLGYFDKHGFLHITGRQDSMLKINGRKVYLNPIEDKLHHMNGVRNVKCIKDEHDVYGEYILAYIELVGSSDPEALQSKIENQIRKILPPNERPKKIIYCNNMKFSSNGKVVGGNC